MMGVNVTTRQLLDSQGPNTKKELDTIKELIKEFAKHSREYHNSREDVIRGNGNGRNENMGTVLE